MAIVQKILNLDAYFRDTPGNKIIVNDLNYYNIKDLEVINDNLMSVYDDDVFDTIPKCDCGSLKGRYNIGRICNVCGNECLDTYADKYPLLWLKQLSPSTPFLNPVFYLLYKGAFKSTKIDYVRWMADPYYNPNNIKKYINDLKPIIGGKRSYTNMINHIEEVLVYLSNTTSIKSSDKGEYVNSLLELYRANKENIFSTYLPILNKRIFVKEQTSMGAFTNIHVSGNIDTVNLWAKYSTDNVSENDANRATISAIVKLSSLYINFINTYMLQKPGILRRHVFSSRIPFSFRTVVVSIPGPHDYDEIYVSWPIAVTVLRPMIMNKLINKYNMTYKKANNLLWKVVKKYDPLIDDILTELINESPYNTVLSGKKGIPVIMNRNPSLLSHSSQRVYITKVKKDVYDKTLSISNMIIKAFNADYDGDELNLFLLIDKKMYDEAEPLEPSLCLSTLKQPYSISGNMTLHATGNTILGDAIKDRSYDVDDSEFTSMLAV